MDWCSEPEEACSTTADRGAVEDGWWGHSPVRARRRGYPAALAAAKAAIQAARTRTVLAVNSELIGLYWDLGRLILDRQVAEGPRSKVIERLSADLRREFPTMRGLSPGNLDYMRRLAAAWPEPSSPQVVGKIPWGHNRVLLDRLDDRDLREWERIDEISWTDLGHRSELIGEVLTSAVQFDHTRRESMNPSVFERLELGSPQERNCTRRAWGG